MLLYQGYAADDKALRFCHLQHLSAIDRPCTFTVLQKTGWPWFSPERAWVPGTIDEISPVASILHQLATNLAGRTPPETLPQGLAGFAALCQDLVGPLQPTIVAFSKELTWAVDGAEYFTLAFVSRIAHCSNPGLCHCDKTVNIARAGAKSIQQ